MSVKTRVRPVEVASPTREALRAAIEARNAELRGLGLRPPRLRRCRISSTAPITRPPQRLWPWPRRPMLPPITRLRSRPHRDCRSACTATTLPGMASDGQRGARPGLGCAADRGGRCDGRSGAGARPAVQDVRLAVADPPRHGGGEVLMRSARTTGSRLRLRRSMIGLTCPRSSGKLTG